MTPVDPQQLGLELGSGAVIGLLTGFAAKKIAKFVALIVGLQMAFFKFLESRGVLNVNWGAVTESMGDVVQVANQNTPPTLIETILSTLSVGAGFTGGFFLGFRRG